MKTICLAVSLSFAACCMQAAAAGSTNAVVSLVGSDLDAVALVVVDGKPLTAAEVRDAVLIASMVRDFSAGKANVPPSGKGANLMAMHLAPQLVSSMVFDAELDRRGLKATAESDAAVLDMYNRKFKSKAKKPEELFSRFGKLAPAFKRQFARESRYRAMYSALPELKVTEGDITEFYRGVSNRIVNCRMINTRARKRIERAWKELEGGRAWEVVATNYTEDAQLHPSLADNWKNWMSLKLNKIEPMELMTAVAALKPGEYTKPIDTEEGLIIAKLLERDEDFCTLARILVRAAVEVGVPERDAAIKKIAKKKEVAFQKKMQLELRKKAKIEYPLGKKYVLMIWDEPKKDANMKVKGKKAK